MESGLGVFHTGFLFSAEMLFSFNVDLCVELL